MLLLNCCFVSNVHNNYDLDYVTVKTIKPSSQYDARPALRQFLIKYVGDLTFLTHTQLRNRIGFYSSINVTSALHRIVNPPLHP